MILVHWKAFMQRFRVLHERKGAEGNGEDSCGVNMIGEAPEGASLRRLSTCPRKASRSLESLFSAIYLETESYSNRPYCVIALIRKSTIDFYRAYLL